MKLSRFTFALSGAASFAAAALLIAAASTAHAKGKPGGGGGGGGNADFAFVFEETGNGLFLTTIDDSDRLRLTSAKGKSFHVEPKWSPDLDPDAPGYQGMIAYIEITEQVTGTLNLYVVNPDGSGNRLVREAISGAGAAWTPTGKEIVLQQFNSRLIAVDVETGILRVLWDNIDNTGPSIRNVALSPLGQLAFDRDSDVFVVDYWLDPDGLIELDPASVVNVTDPDAHEIAPSFSPDGTYLAYSRLRTNDWEILVRDLLTGQELFIVDGLSGDRQVTWSPDGSQLASYIRTTSSRGNSMDLFRIIDWDDPVNRLVIPITLTDGFKSQEITPDWKPAWEER